MTLDYNNPNDWGKSPLTDNALRMQQLKAEKPEIWEALIEEDLEALSTPLFENHEDEESPYPPFTGEEFIANNDTIDSHPYGVAFGQFLGNGISANVANELAFGLHDAITQISDDPSDYTRIRAVNIFDRFNEMDYWRDSGKTDSEPENFTFE